MVGVGEGMVDVLKMTMAVDEFASAATSAVLTDVSTTVVVTSAVVEVEDL